MSGRAEWAFLGVPHVFGSYANTAYVNLSFAREIISIVDHLWADWRLLFVLVEAGRYVRGRVSLITVVLALHLTKLSFRNPII